MFVIEDELHAEQQDGEFATFEDALSELKRRSSIPWDHEPNQAPCTAWRTCGRQYVVIEIDQLDASWKEVSRTDVLEVSAKGVTWLSHSP